MDVELFPLSSDKNATQLKNTIINLGYKCNQVELPTLSKDKTNKIRILLIEEEVFDQVSIELIQESCQLIDIVIVNSTKILNLANIYQCAIDFCMWPIDSSELLLRIQHTIKLRQNSSSYDQATIDNLCLAINMVGQSETFKQTLNYIHKFAKHDANVLIQGNTGTGKELAARAIHYLSPRKSGPFQAINCGALPEQLIENELFGHAKGAYTDARTSQTGMVELANGGTLFLDEIDALSLKSQASLLRFLQDRVYRRLGSKDAQYANVRVIAASNANLEKKAANNEFRQDLLYRINLLSLSLPDLCERKKDIPLLAEHFLNESEIEYKQGKKVFHPYALLAMCQYKWPGNIRELRNFVHREYLLAETPLITSVPDAMEAFIMDANDNKEQAAIEKTSFQEAKQQVIMQFERQYLTQILSQTGGNISLAAELAGKERRAFGKLIKKHGIQRQQFSQ